MTNIDINTFTILTCILSLTGCAVMSPQDRKTRMPKKVLFIGNSYTGGIKHTLNKMVEESEYKDTTLQYITPGGRTLKTHLEKVENLELIKSGDWDYVVLQEQSQTPGFKGGSFQRSVDKFTELIKESGAEPMLYMTWGRKDGDKHNTKLYPDYTTMQTILSEAYRTAAERNDIAVAPVGDAWRILRETDRELGEELYTKDGSHPSNKGAYLASCVFLRALFNDSLESFERPDDLTDDEWNTIKNAALSVNI